jgi:hypothetical protein
MDQAMTPDFQQAPLPAARVQAAALRSAFPGYIVNVIVAAHGEKPLRAGQPGRRQPLLPDQLRRPRNLARAARPLKPGHLTSTGQ